jgi:glycine/D-amino acid oxidase-like deaminating enzyme
MTAPVSGALSPTDVGSYWLASTGDDLTLRAPLAGDETVDVAILGGGFSGLWTAWFLLQADPTLSIAIVERQFCGFGASGRNGGWCSPRFPINPAALTRRFGAETARTMLFAQQAMVEEVGRICEQEGIDAHFNPAGVLTLARSTGQVPSLRQSYDAYAKLGMADVCALLDADQAHEAVHATEVHGALRLRVGGTIHPGRLVRGLARALERRGVRIYEGTEVIQTSAGIQPALVTTGGTIRARRAVLLAGEAFLTGLPDYRRRLIPMASTIMLTAPLTDDQWDQVGWAGGECLSSYVHTTNYLTRTADGRILFGSRGAPYRYGSDMSETALRENANFGWIRDRLLEWWPSLEGYRVLAPMGGLPRRSARLAADGAFRQQPPDRPCLWLYGAWRHHQRDLGPRARRAGHRCGARSARALSAPAGAELGSRAAALGGHPLCPECVSADGPCRNRRQDAASRRAARNLSGRTLSR